MNDFNFDKYKNFVIIASDEPIKIEIIESGKDAIMIMTGNVTKITKINYHPDFNQEGDAND